MGEAVKLDLTKFARTSNSSKADSTSFSNSSTKTSFKDVFTSASNKSDNGLKDIKDNGANGYQSNLQAEANKKNDNLKSENINDEPLKTDSKSQDIKSLKNENSKSSADKMDDRTENSIGTDNIASLTDEQKEKLDKVKEILEQLLSGTENSDEKIDGLLSKIAKLMGSSKDSDTKKGAVSKISDNILEEILSAMNMQGIKLNDILTSSSQSENLDVNELKQDLNKLISSALDDTKASHTVEVNTKFPETDLDKNTDSNEKTVKSSELKLNYMLTGDSEADDEKLLAKIKQEINAITSELKKSDSSQTYNNRLKQNTADVISTSDSNSGASAQNGDSSWKNDSGLSQDDKFLNDLLKDSNTSQDDKISNVTNLLGKFSLNNTNEAVINAKAPIVTKANFSADIIKSLKYMENNNIKDLTIKIMPKGLGEVIIKITSDGGIMKASITASNKEAYSLLNSNLKDLNSSLSNQDIKIQNVEINIYNDDTTFFSGSDSKENGSDSNKNNRSIEKLTADEADDTSEQDDFYNENNINALA